MFRRIELNIAHTVEHKEIIPLGGMHVPRALYLSHRAGAHRRSVMNHAIQPVHTGNQLCRHHIKCYIGGMAKILQRNNRIEIRYLFDNIIFCLHLYSFLFFATTPRKEWYRDDSTERTRSSQWETSEELCCPRSITTHIARYEDYSSFAQPMAHRTARCQPRCKVSRFSTDIKGVKHASSAWSAYNAS